MMLDALPRAAEGRKPSAGAQRRFWAYALHSLGAVIGACVIIYSWSVPVRIADYSVLDEYGRAVSLGWRALFQVVFIVAAALGTVVAMLGLPILRATVAAHPRTS